MNSTLRLLAALPFTAAFALAQNPAISSTPTTAVAVTTTVATVTPVATVAIAAVAPTITSTTPDGILHPTGAAVAPVAIGETSLTLDVGNGIRAVPAARVSVPTGERLRVTGPNSNGRAVQWNKNGRALAGATTNPLIIDYVTSADAGTYSMVIVDPVALSVPSQSLVLSVGPTDRLINLSTRGTVGSAADQGLVSGFVVGGGTRDKKIIIRAVGPSLSQFGVSNPLRQPVLKIFDAAGKPYENGYAYPAVVGGPTYESDLAESLARTGAFPIPSGTRDVVTMMPFISGTYTVQVTSGDGAAGTALLEIYEVP